MSQGNVLSQEAAQALEAWAATLGPSKVLDRAQAMERYGQNTEGAAREIVAALHPESLEEVVQIVRIANRHRVSLYPISIGNNWGYGSSLPPKDGCVIVDLSRMNRILDFDEELGVVTIEPGVTQGQLYEYLETHQLPYLVPINGGGPSCSLVGPALERGFGNIPYLDHFASLMALEAVLPDGEIYRSSFSSMGAETAGKIFKWGVGPYIDGLFTQSNFGIVTRITVALASKPETIQQFSIPLMQDSDLEELVVKFREVLKVAGGSIGLVRIMNQVRSLASIKAPYPFERSPEGMIPPEVVSQMSEEHGIPPWFAAGTIYGEKKMVATVRSILKERFASLGKLKFVTVLDTKGKNGSSGLGKTEKLSKTAFMITKPSQAGLGEAYWKKEGGEKRGELNPARDGCGIIWYAPIIPLKPRAARAYAELVRRVCFSHKIDSLYSLILTSDKYFYGITPLVFRRERKEEVDAAHACYEALFKAGKEQGFLPYRLPASDLHLITDPAAPFWKLASRLKSCIDPNQIISPGRYSTWGKEGKIGYGAE